MKHIIIAGCARTGKTTLGLHFHNQGFVHYKMDSIKRAIFQTLSLNINDLSTISPIIASIISTIINENMSDKIFNNEYYCIDTCHLYPADIINMNLNDTIIVFLGYTSIDKDQKFEFIRKHDNDNIWTNKLEDSELLTYVDLCIQYSKEVKDQCNKLNIPFFDTSKDFNKALDEARLYIENELMKE